MWPSLPFIDQGGKQLTTWGLFLREPPYPLYVPSLHRAISLASLGFPLVAGNLHDSVCEEPVPTPWCSNSTIGRFSSRQRLAPHPLQWYRHTVLQPLHGPHLSRTEGRLALNLRNLTACRVSPLPRPSSSAPLTLPGPGIRRRALLILLVERPLPDVMAHRHASSSLFPLQIAPYPTVDILVRLSTSPQLGHSVCRHLRARF